MDKDIAYLLSQFSMLANRHPDNPFIGDLAAKANKILVDSASAPAPKVFVSINPDGVAYDVASDDIRAIDLFILDESQKDPGVPPVEIEAQDGTTYFATVRKLQATAPHFDIEQVVNGADGTYANGVKL